MDAPYVGEIIMFAGNFAPRGFAVCNGQLLPIKQYDALYSVIGTTFGGDGKRTFALPNLQSRIPIHQGQGAHLSPRLVGQEGGVEMVALTADHLPTHSHTAQGQTNPGNQSSPSGNVWAASTLNQFSPNQANNIMNHNTVLETGGGQAHNNLMPTQAITFCISLFGEIPSQR